MTETVEWQPFAGGQRVITVGLIVGLTGLALTFLRALLGGAVPGGAGPVEVALSSYLVAFTYWLGLALAALVLLMIFHASKARWMIVVRRLIEVLAATVAIFPILFVPIALGARRLYPWAGSLDHLSGEARSLVEHRRVYLNLPFFFGRAALYFVVWIGVSRLFLRWSTRQDGSGAPELTQRAWRLAPACLPLVGLTLTFAAFDWLMSLEVFWFSSIWGVYYFAGSFVAVLGLLIVISRFLDRTGALHGALSTAHWLSLGKFLLAFTCFWAYIAYSQYMLVWIANLPDTIPYLILRQQNGWRVVAIALVIGHFVVPFFLLLSRRLKMNPARLATVGLWILFMHYIDLYAVVMPQVRPHQAWLDWSNVTAFVGIGGVAVAFGVYLLRGRPVIPVRDPFLPESLAYEKMM